MKLTSPHLHHPTLYFDDGNIVLSALTESGDRQYFRVHRSILAKQSRILADMFELPVTTIHADEMYDDVPHVEMPDVAEDLADVLNIIYNPPGLPLKRLDPDTPTRVEGMLRVITKYEFEALHEGILAHLEEDWPQTLAKWDLMKVEIEAMRAEHRRHKDGKIDGLYLDDRLPEAASIVRLANMFDLRKLLPLAYYRLAILNPNAEWYSFRRNAVDDSSEAKYLAEGKRTARWMLLDRGDLFRLLRGKAKLLDCTMSIRKRIVTAGFCVSSFNGNPDCLAGRHAMWEHIERMQALHDPLRALDVCAGGSNAWHHEHRGKVCDACEKRIHGGARAMREEVFGKLGEIFEV